MNDENNKIQIIITKLLNFKIDYSVSYPYNILHFYSNYSLLSTPYYPRRKYLKQLIAAIVTIDLVID